MNQMSPIQDKALAETEPTPEHADGDSQQHMYMSTYPTLYTYPQYNTYPLYHYHWHTQALSYTILVLVSTPSIFINESLCTTSTDWVYGESDL